MMGCDEKVVKYFSFHFWAREDGVFLPSSYYSKVYEALKSLLATEHFTISPIRTKNKKKLKMAYGCSKILEYTLPHLF